MIYFLEHRLTKFEVHFYVYVSVEILRFIYKYASIAFKLWRRAAIEAFIVIFIICDYVKLMQSRLMLYSKCTIVLSMMFSIEWQKYLLSSRYDQSLTTCCMATGHRPLLHVRSWRVFKIIYEIILDFFKVDVLWCLTTLRLCFNVYNFYWVVINK